MRRMLIGIVLFTAVAAVCQNAQSPGGEDANRVRDFLTDAAAMKRKAFEQKVKVVALQDRIQELQNRLERWNSEYWVPNPKLATLVKTPAPLRPNRWGEVNPIINGEPAYVLSSRAILCVTHQARSPEDIGWCNTPSIVEELTKTAQKDLSMEQAKFETLQAEIRRRGYGIQIYDPDLD